jgi:apolipoprotein N-acyltransferase
VALGALLCLAALRRRRAGLVLAAVLLLAVIWTACGGEVHVSMGTPPGTYALKVTATSGVLTHELTLTLGVT